MSQLRNVRTRHDDALSRIGWDEFERVLAAHYRDVGWWVEHVGTAGTGARFDGGIDLRLRRDTQVVLVQCKHWNAKQVPHNAVHELLGILVTEGATGAILITSGEFTAAAIAAAKRSDKIRLIDGRGLRDMLGEDAFSPPPAEMASSVRAPSLRPRHGGGLRLLFRLVALLCAIGFVLVVREMLVRTASTSGEPPVVETRLAPMIAVPPPQQRAPPPPSPEAKPPSLPPPSPAEIRESQRKADEAMRTIEETKPVM